VAFLICDFWFTKKMEGREEAMVLGGGHSTSPLGVNI
jgi:hypothetical protein